MTLLDMIFAHEHRDKLRQEYPKKSMQEIMVIAGERWRHLDEKTKKVFKNY